MLSASAPVPRLLDPESTSTIHSDYGGTDDPAAVIRMHVHLPASRAHDFAFLVQLDRIAAGTDIAVDSDFVSHL